MFLYDLSSVFVVYHSQFTMLVLELNRTEHEQNPSTCIPPDLGLFPLPKSSKAFLASVSGKRLAGMQVSRCSLTQSRSTGIHFVPSKGLWLPWVRKSPAAPGLNSRVELLSTHVLHQGKSHLLQVSELLYATKPELASV